MLQSVREAEVSRKGLDPVLKAITLNLAIDGCQIIGKLIPKGSNVHLWRDAVPISKKIDVGINNRLIFDHRNLRCIAQVTKYQREANGLLVLWGNGASSNWNDDDLFLLSNVPFNRYRLSTLQIGNY